MEAEPCVPTVVYSRNVGAEGPVWPPIIHRHEQLALQGSTKSFETLVKLRMLTQKDGPRAVAEHEEIGDLATNYDVTYIVKRENPVGTVHLRCSSMNDASGADSSQPNPELPAGAGGM
jgi:hypothetical protein